MTEQSKGRSIMRRMQTGSCKDVLLFEPCQMVRCPCNGCDGQLEFTGKNTMDTLVFLECSACRCAHVAPIAKDTVMPCRSSDQLSGELGTPK